MICEIIGPWLLDGKSPYTGLPVTQTRRLVKQPKIAEFCDGDWLYEGAVFTARALTGNCSEFPRDWINCRAGGCATKARRKYWLGQELAIQLKRGGKAVGRIPPLTSIRKQDVRQISHEDAVASGFAGVFAYLATWTAMHDHQVLILESVPGAWLGGLRSGWKRGMCWGENIYMMAKLMERPAERYTAWVLDWKALEREAQVSNHLSVESPAEEFHYGGRRWDASELSVLRVLDIQSRTQEEMEAQFPSISIYEHLYDNKYIEQARSGSYSITKSGVQMLAAWEAAIDRIGVEALEREA